MELTGKKYETHIMRLDFAPKWAGLNAAFSDNAEIRLRVSAPRWHPRAASSVSAGARVGRVLFGEGYSAWSPRQGACVGDRARDGHSTSVGRPGT
jgi:hypothetical protein